MAATRRLAAILAADVAGYSRLMGADEEGTHAALTELRRTINDPQTSEHHGRIVKTTGDGLLAEFASVVDAVRCAVAVQGAMAEVNTGGPTDRRIEFRIGINLGDIIIEEGDIFGDGINIAARIEALADAGGICLSQTVRDHVGDRLNLAFEDLGEQNLKNIARPVRVYRVRDAADLPALSVLPIPPISEAAAMPRLSIVVLPFANLSGDQEQQYFADAITEDLTTDLSRPADMFVISRNTAFTYRNKPVDTKQIGRELGVRYVLEGSVRRSSNRLRVNAQLIDTETDGHIWAERFDGDTSDLFAVQDEITSRIAIALNVELVTAEAGRTAEHSGAMDYVLRGRAVMNKPNSRDNYASAVSLFESALALDPNSVEAQSRLARALVGRVFEDMTSSRAADIGYAEEMVERALAQFPNHPQARYAKGQLLRWQHRFDDAIVEYETSLAFNRNFLNAYVHIARCKLGTGLVGEAILLYQQAIRLSPRDPNISTVYWGIGDAHLLQSRIDESTLWLEKARNANPALGGIHAALAAAYALKGDTERAAFELTEARRLSGVNRYSSIASLRASGTIRSPYETIYFAGLRKAGLPEE
jgi:adenylate cyclase